MADIISFINMKGGVGKTTLSIGIADYLSDIGKKVLLLMQILNLMLLRHFLILIK